MLAFEIPNIINTMGLDLALQTRAEADRIMIDFVAPHHFKPLTFLKDFISLGGWTLMGLAFLPGFAAASDAKSRFGSLFISGVVMVALATMLTTIVFITPVSRLFVWRMAPFVLLMAQIIVVIAALRPFFDPSSANAPSHWQLGLASLGLVLILVKDVIHHNLFLPPSRSILLMACGELPFRRRHIGFAGCLPPYRGRRPVKHQGWPEYGPSSGPGAQGHTVLGKKQHPSAYGFLPAGVGGFSTLSRRPVWIDWEIGAMAMWAPETYEMWSTRWRQLKPVDIVAEAQNLARKEGVRFIVFKKDKVAYDGVAKSCIAYEYKLFWIMGPC